MSAKRGAAVQINSETYDPDAEGESEPVGTWQKADEVRSSRFSFTAHLRHIMQWK